MVVIIVMMMMTMLVLLLGKNTEINLSQYTQSWTSIVVTPNNIIMIMTMMMMMIMMRMTMMMMMMTMMMITLWNIQPFNTTTSEYRCTN